MIPSIRGLLADLAGSTESIYVMEADRSAFMLFDADPDSSIVNVPYSWFGHL